MGLLDRRGRPWARLPLLLAGVAAVLVAVLPPLALRAQHNLPASVVQFALLLYLAAPLLVAGSPVRPRRVPKVLADPDRSWGLVVAAPALAVLITFGWYFTPWISLTVHHLPVRVAGYLVLLVAGGLFSLPATRALSGGSELAYPLLLFLCFLELLMDALPGLVLTFEGHAAVGRVLTDQHFGGEMLWAIGEVVDVPFLAAVVWRWTRSDAKAAEALDRELDLRAPLAADGSELTVDRPWWERDASVFGARAAQFRKRAPDAPS